MSYMLSSLLLLSLLILPSALPQLTVSPANLVTARPTATQPPSRTFAGRSRARGETKYTYDGDTGNITCNTAGTAVSNCDILELLRDDHVYMDDVHLLMKKHLQEIEAQVLEGLGQLQEV